jgi:hypothetical protein
MLFVGIVVSFLKHMFTFRSVRLYMVTIPLLGFLQQHSLLWNVYILAIYWILLQCFVIEIISKLILKTPWKDVEELDVALGVVAALFIGCVSGSIFIDFIPENNIAIVYKTNNILSSYQCDSIIALAEAHAHANLQRNFPTGVASSSYGPQQSLIENDGWQTTRHANYPTTDMSAYAIKANITLRKACGQQDVFVQAASSRCPVDLDRTTTIATSSSTTTTTISMESSEKYTMDFGTWLNETVEDTILPLLARQHNVPVHLMSMRDLFVVKYDADTPHRQRHLQTHIDSSQLSFNIALSTGEDATATTTTAATAVTVVSVTGTADMKTEAPDGLTVATAPKAAQTYSGGGTYFVRSQRTEHVQKGGMLSHPSRIYHAGSAVSKGTLYDIVHYTTTHCFDFFFWPIHTLCASLTLFRSTR